MPLQDDVDPERAWRERLEERLGALETALRAGNTSIDRGKLRVITDGHLTAEIGKDIDSDNEVYDGMRVARSDGKTLLRASRFDDGTSRVEMQDRYGNAVLRDEKNLGGLSRPWIPIVVSSSSKVATWPTTVSPTFEILEQAYFPQQQSRLFVYATVAVVGGTGEAQIQVQYAGDAAQHVVIGPLSVPNGGRAIVETIQMPELDRMYNMVSLSLLVRRTSGAVTVAGAFTSVFGLGGDL